MKTQVKQPQPVSHTIQSKTKAANQADIQSVLQKYAERHENANVGATLAVAQREGIDDEELLQCKFSDTVQCEALDWEEEEPLQGKFSDTAQLAQEETPNVTGIPGDMKTCFENFSGFSFNDVRVNYNSPKPSLLNALAYTQGNQVYIAPGQEKHLGHELGHVVQQKQGRVQPTMQRQGINVNDDERLEKEADIIGRRKSIQFKKDGNVTNDIIQKQSNLDEDGIKDYTCDYINKLLKDKDYKDSEGNQIEINKGVISFIFNADYGGCKGTILLPDVYHVNQDIDNGTFEMAISHEVGHYVRKRQNLTEKDSFPEIETLVGAIKWNKYKAKMIQVSAKQENWEEEIKADLKGVLFRYQSEGKLPTKQELSDFQTMLGSAVDATHPPAALRVEKMQDYIKIINNGQKGGGCCYITTACVDSMGLSDDCDELTTLRNFRDTYLMNKDNGQELIDLYYSNAPQIVASIHRRPDKELILKELFGIIKNCVNAIKAGDNEYAFQTYCDMVLKLKEEYD